MKVPKARQLPSGAWFIQLRLGGQSIPITAEREKDCIRQAQLIKAEYLADKGPRRKKEPITLQEAIDRYIASRSNVLSPSTIRGYRTIQKTRFQSMMAKKLAMIKEADWIMACNAEAKLCSPKTLTNAWRFIASVLSANGETPPKVALPQIPPSDRPFLEPEQIKTFVQAVKGTDVEIPALLALSSLRRSEICALRWENVDFAKKRIQVKGAAVYDENQKVVQKQTNKNISSARYVPIMMPELLAALKREKQPAGLVVACAPNTLRHRINRICKKEGLPEVGVHGLRHSFASLAYHLGVPEKIAMEIGGWSNSQTMHKIYTHIAKSDTERYITQMTDFYDG